MENTAYSVLMSIYHKDNPKWLKEAIDSMLSQTIPPAEFIIVKDGFIGDNINTVILTYEQLHPKMFKIIQLPKNVGAGAAKHEGTKHCTCEFIAIMDADDISVNNRIEKSLSKFNELPELDVVGGLVDEFTDTTGNIIAHVLLPESHNEIVSFAKKRCPVRHTTMLYRKNAILQVGGYSGVRFGEEYDIVVRLILAGCKLYNIQEVLCYMRVNKDFYNRRGGIRHLRDVYIMKSNFVKSGFFSIKDFLLSILPHALVILMPGFIREFIYKKFLRGSV